MKFLRLLLLTIGCIFCNTATANETVSKTTQAPKEREKIIFGLAGVTQKDRPFRLGAKVLKEISKKTGYKMDLITLPHKRAKVMLKKGEIDADLARIKEFSDNYNSFVMVDEPIVKLPFYAYSKNKDVSIEDIKSSKTLRIAALRGQVFSPTFFKSSQITFVNSIKSGFWFLHKKRADIFVTDEISAQTTTDILKLEELGIYKLNQPLAVVDAYTFFSAENADIAIEYKKALIEIKKEGIYDKIFEETK
ncbi:MAG: hypothetical protein D6B28_09250 [Gammaproteobacteria bacterium]|nr:MAG: hypothetical protein D6B28_09250 [Gammaproteobacteria bacterium]